MAKNHFSEVQNVFPMINFDVWDRLGHVQTIFDPGKVIFGHFIDFGHFPIEIPIEAEKFYRQQKEGLYIKNKNCFENQRPNGTI